MIDDEPLPTAAAHTREAFRAAYGEEPYGIWTAPGRINLIGEHTDYNDGYVLPLALPQRVNCAAAARADGVLRIRSLQAAGAQTLELAGLCQGEVTGWPAYVAGVVWAWQAAGYPVDGVDLLLDGCVPEGAGLSSSAAVECAVAVALADLFDVRLDRSELARLAQRAENDFVGVPCGIMDQLAAMHGRAGHALFIDTRSLAVEPVALDLAGHGLALLVINTRAPHRLVDGDYRRRREACERAASLLGVPALRDIDPSELAATLQRLPDEEMRRRVRHVVTENARVLEVVDLLRSHSAGGLRRIGPLLTASHQSLRYDFEVSCPELDTAVEAALGAGAVGARMTGAGFGGSAIALVPATAVQTVAAAVAEAFTRHGFTSPQMFPATPADGAGRLA